MKWAHRLAKQKQQERDAQRSDAALIAQKVTEAPLHVARWALILALVAIVSQIATCGILFLR